jgi:hypothetical protein
MFRSLASVAIAAFCCSASLAQQAPSKQPSAAAKAAPSSETVSNDEERALEIAIKP